MICNVFLIGQMVVVFFMIHFVFLVEVAGICILKLV